MELKQIFHLKKLLFYTFNSHSFIINVSLEKISAIPILHHLHKGDSSNLFQIAQNIKKINQFHHEITAWDATIDQQENTASLSHQAKVQV